MAGQIIEAISVMPVPVFYRKELGKNAYGENIGQSRTEWIVRMRTSGGLEGLTIANRFMRGYVDFFSPGGTVRGLVEFLRENFIGKDIDGFLETSGNRVTGVKKAARPVFRDHGWSSIAIYDLVARERGVSCVELLGGKKRDAVPAYDTTLYFQDLIHPDNGAAQVAIEAKEAFDAGWRQFKIKTGRGGRWMTPEAGMLRDVEVVLGVREAVGPDAVIMVDANFGYDGRLDLLEAFVSETLPANVFWLEEMVTASVAHYRAFRDIQERAGSTALLVCGEVDRQPIGNVFQDIIDEGLIDGYQPDIVSAGFATWQEIERRLEGTRVRSIPHNFGNGNFGTRATIIFGAASASFASLEDERHLPHVYAQDSFAFENGAYRVASAPGLGLEIDDEALMSAHGKHIIEIR